jgi:Ala-tRNA(Pro) deacylase
VLGLVNDVDGAVELYVDRDVWDTPRWRCHPLVNTATLVLARTDLERFFAHTGHRPNVVDLRVLPPS